jgi:hypothetical protein
VRVVRRKATADSRWCPDAPVTAAAVTGSAIQASYFTQRLRMTLFAPLIGVIENELGGGGGDCGVILTPTTTSDLAHVRLNALERLT